MSFLISKNEIIASEVSAVNESAQFRKATMNMKLAFSACEKALAPLPDLPKENISFIVATHFGEVQSTLDFLSTYSETQVPSPILFQNSLHNSTLGFVAIQLGFVGPAMTISLAGQTQDSLQLLVQSMVDLGKAVIICFVDYIPLELQPHYLANFPFLKNTLNRAIAYAFVNSELKEAHNLDPLNFEKFF